MALRKPLVLIDGNIAQLPTSDTLDASVIAIDVIQMTNGETSTASAGQPIYISGADTFKLGQANSLNTSKIIGLLREDIAAGSTGMVQLDGILELPDWTTVTGNSSLTPGASYYLDPDNAGMLTETPPTASGQYLVYVGKAISTTAINLDIARPIIL